MRQFTAIFTTLLRSFMRDTGTLVFSLLFPLIFLVIFGFVFSGQEGELTRPTLAFYLDDTKEGTGEMTATLQGMDDLLHLAPQENRAEVQAAVVDGRAHFGLLLNDSQVELVLSPTRLQGNPYYTQLGRSITTAYNQVRTGTVEIMGTRQERLTVREGMSHLDYMIPGVIALGILSTGMFGITASLMHLREKGVLKRLAATPMKRASFIAGLMTTRILAVFLSTAVVLLVSRLVFGATFALNWPLFILFASAATLGMMGLGLFITLFAKSARNASEIGGILMTVMIFFSGVYFPTEFLPSYFQQLARVMPLTYVAAGMRYVMNVEPMSSGGFLLVVAGLLLGTALMLLLSSRRLTWEDVG